MRSESELRRAIAVLGATLTYRELREHVFGGAYNDAVWRAWMVFSCLGWMVGAEETLFTDLLAHVELKLKEYGVHVHRGGGVLFMELKGDANDN